MGKISGKRGKKIGQKPGRGLKKSGEGLCPVIQGGKGQDARKVGGMEAGGRQLFAGMETGKDAGESRVQDPQGLIRTNQGGGHGQ